MVQLQALNYVISSKDMTLLTDNGLSSDYFLEYEHEYNFIIQHYEVYKQVPDIETVVSKFPEFEVLEVTESKRYLVETLREEFLYAKSVPVIKKAAELLKTDANEASRYLQSELINLTPNYTIPYVDIIHSNSRFDLFENKSTNPDAWFIPTGFEELDDVLNGGWQLGEEYGVIYARTGQGKSWVLVKSMQHAWVMGRNVGYISPEMTADKIGYRFDTLNKHFSNRDLLKGNTDAISVNEYKQYAKNLATKTNKFIVSTPLDFNKKITVSKLRSFVIENKLDVLAIDGITYLSDERSKRGDNKTTTLTNISEDLMQLSVELKIPVLVVVQSNREGVKDDANATPDLENIRDSDGISHNATIVIALRQKDEGLLMEIKKNRNGRIGTKINYQWDINTGDFAFIPSKDDAAVIKSRPREKVAKKEMTERKIAF